MKKKILIILLIVLFTLLATIEVYVQSDAFADRIRPFVVEPLQTALGEGAKIGWVKANFIPLYLEVRDISIPDARSQEAITLRKVRIYINPLPLLQKKIRLASISLLEPRIHAVRAQDGTVNLDPIVERIRRNMTRSSSEGQSGFSLLLRTITIRDGQVTFMDNMTSIKSSLTGINVNARVGLSQESGRVDLKSSRASFSSPSYPELSGDFRAALRYDKGRFHMESAELSTADASLSLSGDVGPLPDAVLDLKVKARSGPRALRRLTDILKLSRKQETSRIEAAALIQGKASDPVIDGTLKVTSLPVRGFLLQSAALSFAYKQHTVSLKGGKWKLSKGDKSIVIDDIDAVLGYREGGLDIERFTVRAEDLALGLEGRAALSTGFDAQLSVESSGAGRTIAFLTAMPLEGSVGIQGRISGALARPQLDARVIAGPVKIRGIEFSDVRGEFAYRDNRVKLSSVEIREHSSRYVFDGSVDLNGKEPVYSARLRVLQSDVVNIVALFYEQLPLRLSAEGELSFEGTARNYTGNGYLKLGAGSAYGESFTRGTITARLSTGRIAFPQVVLYKERGLVKATGWIGFDGTYSSDLESTGVDLATVDHLAGMPLGGEFKLSIHSSGSFSHPYVKASLALDALSYRQAPAGGTEAAAEIKDGILTLNAGLSDDRANLSLRSTLGKPYAWTAEAHVRSDAIDPLLMLGNNGHAGGVTVVADGSMTARGKGLDISSLSGKAVFQRLSLIIGDFRMDNESDASLSLDNGRLAVTSLNFIGPGTRIGVSGRADLMKEIDLTLKGTANLSLLKLLYHEVEHAGGVADVKLTIKDDWKNPDLAGELRIQNGEIKVQDIPQRFTAVNGRIVLSQGRIVADSLTGGLGGGTMNVSGRAQLAGTSLQEFSVKAAVDNVTVRYPEGLTSTLSGALYYDGDRSEQTLSGDITIKRARYDKRIEWKTMLVDIGRGLYQKKKTDVGWIGDTRINVRFHGTDSILIQNNLATMPLDVDVFLRGTVNHPQLLGRIEARKGIVYFRKNEFTILNVSVDFVDPNRMNPVLDIQAETQVREYRIRLSVTGTAEHAAVTFTSEPTLIDTDILSLLALGKKGSEIKGKESGVGVGEAASFATGQFQDIFERRARSLTGLDRFQVDPYVGKSDTSVPRVTVGKEIVQNKLYVTYSSNVGAAIPEQIFRIEYLLNKHFSLVGERNEIGNNGADIKYRFEFK